MLVWDRRKRAHEAWAWIGAAVAAALLLAAFATPMSAATPSRTTLSNADVSPRTGTTATTIQITVVYRNDRGFSAESVTATVGATDHSMDRLPGGDWLTGVTYRWSGSLPTGTHAVVLTARAGDNRVVTLSAGTITIGAVADPDAEADPDADTEADPDPDADAQADPDTDPDAHAQADADPDAYTQADAEAHAEARADADAGPGDPDAGPGDPRDRDPDPVGHGRADHRARRRPDRDPGGRDGADPRAAPHARMALRAGGRTDRDAEPAAADRDDRGHRRARRPDRGRVRHHQPAWWHWVAVIGPRGARSVACSPWPACPDRPSRASASDRRW